MASVNTYILNNKEYPIEIIRKNNKNTYLRVKEGKIIVTTNYLTSSFTINKLIKDNRKVLKERFEKFPTLDSQLTVVDGRLAYKEGSQLTDKSVNDFKNRVKGVNQALHGIYNIIDKNALQESAFGDLFMQFRKWIRPNFIRYFGRRFNKTQFNEMLGTWEVPVYKPSFDWATYGL